jgi:chromosome segregation ATPase
VDPAERIRLAAEREAARDRRVLWIYLALAMVPVILAVAFFRTGRTDRKIIQDEIAPVKTQIEEVQPALREVRQFGTLASQVRALGDVAERVNGAVAKVEEQGQELARLKDTTATVLSSRDADSKKLDEHLTMLNAQLATLKSEQETIQRNQVKLQSDVGNLMRRRPGGDVDLDNIIKRLSTVEGEMRKRPIRD